MFNEQSVSIVFLCLGPHRRYKIDVFARTNIEGPPDTKIVLTASAGM